MTSNNKSKKLRRTGKKLSGGGCGCGTGPGLGAGAGASPFFLKGGAAEPPSFTNVPLRSFYGGKDESANPLYAQVASRLEGGGKRRKKTKKNKSKKSISKRNNKNIKYLNGGYRINYLSSEPEFKLIPTNTMV